MDPLVSIVIPLYNYEKYIKDCLISILNQDYNNIEVLVVDDCSTDQSYSVAKEFESDRVLLLRHDINKGYSVAKNSGIIKSKGDYIIVLDADDMLTKDSVSSRINVLLMENSDFIHADAIAVYDDISIKDCYLIQNPQILHFPTPYAIHAQTVIVKRDTYKKFGLYEEKLRSVSDMEMWWRFFGKSETDKPRIKRSYISSPVVYYRYHNKSMTVYRQRNKKYDLKVKNIANEVYKKRMDEGINTNNTVMLLN